MTLASIQTVRARALTTMRPPPKLTLSEWADKHFRLSAENAAVPGQWTTLPFQREIMDAMSDPRIPQVSLMKSARVGYTSMLTAACAYHMTQDPCGILLARPDQEACREFTKEVLAPMRRDVPSVAAVLQDGEVSDKDNTLTHMRFPGGVLSLVGAHSGAGFRSVSRRVVMFDETDAYPPSAGSDGDQIALGMKRSETFWNRKTLAGSTPLVTGASRIETLFSAGDRRRYHVPCPHCGHFDFLVFSPRSDARGHVMVFESPAKGEEPVARDVHFECSRCHGRMEHSDKRALVSKGKWVAEAPFHGHASFHIWSAYSFSPGAAWQAIADEFLKKKGDRKELRTFVNTTLGETMPEAGDAPDWEPLYARRETYAPGSLPDGVKVITLGVDVHKDRLVYEAVGWGCQRESWSLDFGVLLGDVSGSDVWRQLDELIDRDFGGLKIRMTAIDSSAYTQQVYSWVRGKPGSRVMACKGVWGSRALVGVPTAQDVTTGGRTIRGGVRLWPLGVDGAKSELYGWLHLAGAQAGEPHPLGWCHFPEWPEEYFRQLTAEKLTIEEKRGVKTLQWKVLEGRENHLLDARVYARAAASRVGVDRLKGTTTIVQANMDRTDDADARDRTAAVAALVWGPASPAPAAPAQARPGPALPAATPPGPPQPTPARPAPARPAPARPAQARPAPARKSWLRGGSSGGWL